MSHPKILIISHNALSLHSNNGKTLSSLFSGWPDTHISQLYFQDEIPESVKFRYFFRVRDIDLFLYPFRRLFAFKHEFCIPAQSRVLDHFAGASRWKLLIVNFFRKFNALKLIARDLIYGTGFWKSSDLLSWLEVQNPNAIFFLGGNSIFSFKIARLLARKLKVPLNVYITDDYIINNDDPSLLARLMRNRLKAEYRCTFGLASKVFVIGEEMASVFQAEFGRSFIPLMNSVPVPCVLPVMSRNLSGDHAINIVYAGGLHLGRDVAIVKFSKILKKISILNNLKFNFSVYSMAKLSGQMLNIFRENDVEFMGGIPGDELQHTLSASDFVLHAESFDSKYTRLTKLSVSTKIPEYLSSGSCLVAFGPADLASIKLISKNSLGVAISSESLESSGVDDLLRVIVNHVYRDTLIKNGFDYASSNFHIDSIQKKLLQLLKD